VAPKSNSFRTAVLKLQKARLSLTTDR